MPETPSFTELNPLKAMRPQLRTRGYIIPAALAIAGLFVMMQTRGRLFWFFAACFLVAGEMGLIYAFCGKRKPWWSLVGTMAATAILLVIFSGPLSFLNGMFTFALDGWIVLIGPGLFEELFKAIPVFLLIAAATGRSPSSRDWAVSEPLDGILIGAASGFGFALLETFSLYANSSEQIFVRFLSNIVGHAAFSGYFGYFIGLAALRPERRAQTILTGLGFSFMVHNAWDFFAVNRLGLFLLPIAILSYAGLAAAILKARQISPQRNRNFATVMVGAPAPVLPRLFPEIQSGPILSRQVQVAALVLRPLAGMRSDDRFTLGVREVKIGRDPKECYVVLPFATEGVSRVHCAIRTAADGRSALLRDCRSSNGTFLGNGTRVSHERDSLLPEGSTFYLGGRSVMFQIRREIG